MERKYAVSMVIIAMVIAPSSAAPLVTFIFGDSLTEVGNNNYLQLSLAKSNYPHYGIDFEGGKATGRFTNGKTIEPNISINYLYHATSYKWPMLVLDSIKKLAPYRYSMCILISAEKLRIPPPPPYLSLEPNDDAILKGANYASGGAGILNDTWLYFIERLSFDDQISKFESTKQSIKAKIGDEGAKKKIVNKAVFFIEIDGQQYTHDEFLELLISILGEQLTVLFDIRDSTKLVQERWYFMG